MSKIVGGQCAALCTLCSREPEDPLHAFFNCQFNVVTGVALRGYVQSALPNISPEAVLRLELGNELSDVDELISTGMKYIWESRVQKKVVELFKMRAEIEAKVSILRKTRHREAGDRMLDLLA